MLDSAAIPKGIRRTYRAYKTPYHKRSSAKKRRDRLSQLQPDGTRLRCINENAQGTHGPPTNGCRCATCADTHKESW